MNRLLYTTPTHTHTLALDFSPDSLPGPGILRMWLDAFSVKDMLVATLQAKLIAGEPFAFGNGTIEWREDNE